MVGQHVDTRPFDSARRPWRRHGLKFALACTEEIMVGDRRNAALKRISLSSKVAANSIESRVEEDKQEAAIANSNQPR